MMGIYWREIKSDYSMEVTTPNLPMNMTNEII